MTEHTADEYAVLQQQAKDAKQAARAEYLAKGYRGDGVPGPERQKALDSGDTDVVMRLNAELELVNARMEQADSDVKRYAKLGQQARAKEAAAHMGDYYKALAKAAQKITAANQKLAEAWAEADTALKDLRQARTHAQRASTAIEPAGDDINKAVVAAWRCAHTQDMAEGFYSPVRRDSVAKALGHSIRNVSLVPGANETIIV